jgi:hypothetical protein
MFHAPTTLCVHQHCIHTVPPPLPPLLSTLVLISPLPPYVYLFKNEPSTSSSAQVVLCVLVVVKESGPFKGQVRLYPGTNMEV